MQSTQPTESPNKDVASNNEVRHITWQFFIWSTKISILLSIYSENSLYNKNLT
jgi:hypothetical protein